jgi:hypothetical protein
LTDYDWLFPQWIRLEHRRHVPGLAPGRDGKQIALEMHPAALLGRLDDSLPQPTLSPQMQGSVPACLRHSHACDGKPSLSIYNSMAKM